MRMWDWISGQIASQRHEGPKNMAAPQFVGFCSFNKERHKPRHAHGFTIRIQPLIATHYGEYHSLHRRYSAANDGFTADIGRAIIPVGNHLTFKMSHCGSNPIVRQVDNTRQPFLPELTIGLAPKEKENLKDVVLVSWKVLHVILPCNER